MKWVWIAVAIAFLGIPVAAGLVFQVLAFIFVPIIEWRERARGRR